MTKRAAFPLPVGLLILWLCVSAASAATLEVGPGKRLWRIEDANAQAKPGDVIEVYPLPDGLSYQQVAVYVRKPRLTFRGVMGKNGEPVKLSGEGFVYSGRGRTPRAMFQFNRGADGCVLENFEIFGAHNREHIGAGVRIVFANDVTVRNCDIHNNDAAVMSSGDGSLKSGANQRLEFCRIHHNGVPGRRGYNHNLYLAGASVTLHGCEVYASLAGHNVKSRAHYTRVEYCYIHYAANREFDIVDSKDTEFPGSDAVLIGNVIVKDPACTRNQAVIHFGKDGKRRRDGTLYLINNTIVTPFRSPVLDLSDETARVRCINNIFYGTGRNQILVRAAKGGAMERNAFGTHNFISASFVGIPARFRPNRNTISRKKLVFADPSKHNWRLGVRDALIVDAGLPWDTLDIPRVPPFPWKKVENQLFSVGWQYKHPAEVEKRIDRGKPDLGAYAAR